MKLKKIFLAACAATMVLAGATVASAAAPQLKVNYNENLSTTDTAVVEVYYVGADFDSEMYKSLNITLGLMDGTTNVSKTYFSSASVEKSLAGGSTANCMLNASNKNIMCVGAGGGDVYGYLTWNAETGHIATFTIDLAKPIDKVLTFKATAARYQRSSDSSNQTATTLAIDTVKPLTNAVAGTTISTDANSDAATYFVVETTGVSGATPYWYATVDGAAKKVAFTDANIEGTVNVGLVSTGTVSNAKVVWE